MDTAEMTQEANRQPEEERLIQFFRRLAKHYESEDDVDDSYSEMLVELRV